MEPNEVWPDGTLVDGETVVPEEPLSLPKLELEVCGSEMVSRLWISVHVSATPVDSGVSVGTAGDVPEITMMVGDPDGPGNVKVCRITLYDTGVEELVGVSLPTDEEGPNTKELGLGDGLSNSETTGDGVSVVRMRE